MWVYDSNVACGRVSSLFALNTSLTRYVEVGWFENPQGAYNCLPDTPGGSTRELAFAYLDGSRACLRDPAVVQDGQSDGFRVQDSNQNAVWSFYRNDRLIWQSPDMLTFVTGRLTNNGERLNLNDVARAKFDGLRRMINATEWVYWDGTYKPSEFNDDPDFKGCKDSDTKTRVIPNDEAC